MFTHFGKSVLRRGRVLTLFMLTAMALAITVVPAQAQATNPAAPGAAQQPAAAQQAGAQAPADVPCPANGQCFADVPAGNPFYDFVNRIYQQGLVTGYPCGGTGEPCDSENRPYYRPVNNVTRQQMAKFIDNARRLPQILISVPSGNPPVDITNLAGKAIAGTSISQTAILGVSHDLYGVQGISTSSYGLQGTSPGPAAINGYNTAAGYGVEGYSIHGYGVRGYGDSNDGVRGESNGPAGSAGVRGISVSNNGYGLQGTSAGPAAINGYDTAAGYGVEGYSVQGYGVRGHGDQTDGVHGDTGGGPGAAGVRGISTNGEGVVGTSTHDVGVYAESTTGSGLYATSSTGAAGYFNGNVTITGTCTGCAGPSRIDDPLDPANKYLYQASVQSNDMLDIYSGNVTTDANGEAVVALPGYFEALNKDFRYQLTVLDQFAQAIVSSEISDNHFSIKTDKPNVKVSWQVTGTRNDPYESAHNVTGEVQKPAGDQGKYLHPTELGQPASSAIDQKTPAQSNP